MLSDVMISLHVLDSEYEESFWVNIGQLYGFSMNNAVVSTHTVSITVI